jgi:hypothetical protein
MPDEESVETSRERNAFHRALGVFEDELDRDATLGNLRLAEPWFAPGVGEIGLLTDDDMVVVVDVDINDIGHTARTGPFGRRLLEVTDTAGAAQTLRLSENESAQLLERVEHSLRAGITAYNASTSEYDIEDQRLTRNMNTLTGGLERIERTYSDHVRLAYEDPLTFGGGHFVLYPMDNTRSRFAIEEKYTGTDWSDPDRLPTSWTWHAERDVRQRDGTYRWHDQAHGEVPSDNVAQLLSKAQTWARRTRDIAVHTDALKQAPASRRPIEPPRL